jgi:hypothetical protein
MNGITIRPRLSVHPALFSRFEQIRPSFSNPSLSLPRHYHAPRRFPSHCVAVRRVPEVAPLCAAPSKRLETAGVSVVLRGLGRSAPDTIRTYDLGFRKALLYPAELRGLDGPGTLHQESARSSGARTVSAI